MRLGGYNIDKEHAFSFFRTYSKLIADKVGIDKIPQHQLDQVVLRSIICNECTTKGHCISCNCDTDLYYDPLREDALGNWGPMMDEDTWNNFMKHVTQVMVNLYKNYYDLNHFKALGPDKGIIQLTGFDNTKDIGVIEQKNCPVSHRFYIKNSTDKDLIIKDIIPSCHCTIASPSDHKITTNESVEIIVTYDGKNKGDFSKTVSIYFVDSKIKPVLLTLKGKVV